MYQKGLFNAWVPKPVQLLLLFIFIIPLLTINSVYGSNISDMSGSLGILSDDLNMASYAGIIGMVTVFPLIVRMKPRFKTKHLLMFSFVSLTLLSYVCVETQSAPVLIGSSFLLGMVKMIGTAEVIVPIMFTISPNGDRAKFYSVFYPLTIVMNMVSSYLTATISYDHNWQQVYAFAIPLLLICLLLVIVFCHNSYGAKSVPLYQFDWLSLVLLGAAMMLVNFVFSYARMLNWFDSKWIVDSLIGAGFFLFLFIWRQFTLKRPYILPLVFGKDNVYISLVLMFLMGIFTATSGIQGTFTTGVLRYSSVTNAELNLMTALGAVFGGILGFLWLRKKWAIKGLIFAGFSIFIVYHILLYFLFNPVIDMKQMLIPVFLKGVATILLYISLGVHAAKNLGIFQFLSTVPIQILLRSFFGPAFWGAIYSYQQYAGQLKHGAAIVQRMDSNDPFFTSRLQSVGVGQSPSVQGVWGAVQVQAILASSKELFGWIILAGILVLVLVLFLRFGAVNLRPWVRIRKRFLKNKPSENAAEMLVTIAP